MSICPNCNSSLQENAIFCASCGSKVSPDTPQQVRNHSSKLHCPQCKSHNLMVTTESSVTGAVTTSSRSGRISSSHVSNNHQTFWVCGDCGTKFRNIQSLDEEIKKYKNSPTIFFVLAIVAAIICIYLSVNSMSNPLAGFMLGGYAVGSGIAVVIFICCGLYNKSKLRKMNVELEELKIKCFD